MNEELHSYQSGALLPALQALFSGVFFSGVLAGVLLWTGAENAGTFLLSGGFGVAFVAWILLLRHWLQLVNHREGIRRTPRIQVLDPVQHQPSSVRVELFEETNSYWRGDFLNLPATHEQLRLLASGVVSGGSLSENAWCGSNRPFTKSQFQDLRQALLERGWLQWRNQNAPAQGVEVTHVGRRVFAFLAENNYLPAGSEDW